MLYFIFIIELNDQREQIHNDFQMKYQQLEQKEQELEKQRCEFEKEKAG